MKIGGKKIPPWLAWGGGIGGGLVLFIVIRNRGSSAGAAGAAAGGSAIDPVTGLPASEDNQQDPLTGMTYLAEAEQYGSVQAAEEASSGFGLPGGSSGFGGTSGFPSGGSGGGTPTVTSFATNAAWAQAVTAGLAGLGYNSETVAAALGLYFAQHPLTADQASIVQAAVAEFGPPPQGTYPIITAGNGTGSGSGTKPEVTVPADLAGTDVEQATQILRSAGLKAAGPAGAKGVIHVVTGTSPAAGAKVGAGTTVTLHYKTVSEKARPRR